MAQASTAVSHSCIAAEPFDVSRARQTVAITMLCPSKTTTAYLEKHKDELQPHI